MPTINLKVIHYQLNRVLFIFGVTFLESTATGNPITSIFAARLDRIKY